MHAQAAPATRSALPILAMTGALAAACAGARVADPADFDHPRPAGTAPVAWTLPADADPLLVEEALRDLVKPPSLCFAQPQLCGLEGRGQALVDLRPTEETLDLVERTLTAHHAAWPLPSVVLHCETLCAWRPSAGRTCVKRLADSGVTDPAVRVHVLRLLDVLGPHGNSVQLRLLQHPDVEVRRVVAAHVAERAADDALLQPLTELLDAEPDAVVAAHLVRALGLMRDVRVAGYLERLVKRTRQSTVRAEAITALTWLGTASYRAQFFLKLQAANAVEAAALDGAMRALRDNAETPEVVPADLTGAFAFWALPPPHAVGGVAFVAAFERRHARPLRWADGERLDREDLALLLRLLKDGGGVGLGAVRATLGRSCTEHELPALLDIRRAIHVAGLPSQEGEARDMTEVLQVVRTHHRAGRATRYWQREVRAQGEPLRVMP